MEPHVLGAVLYWLLLPFALLAACLFRVNALSLVYLLFLLLLPWFPGPSRHSIRGHTGRLLRALLGFSLLFLAAHVTFQICLHTVPRLDQLLEPNCSTWDTITWDTISRLIGVTRLDLKDIPNAIRLVAPDLGILVVSSLCLGVCRRLTRTARHSQHVQEPVRAMGHPRSQPFEDCCTSSFFLSFLFLNKRGHFSCKSLYVPTVERRDSSGKVKCVSRGALASQRTVPERAGAAGSICPKSCS